jgi:hypothetical protein
MNDHIRVICEVSVRPNKAGGSTVHPETKILNVFSLKGERDQLRKNGH